MKAYTDNFTVRPDGIYRIERIYHPGGEWEYREVLWLSREALETAFEKWEMKRKPLTGSWIGTQREDGSMPNIEECYCSNCFKYAPLMPDDSFPRFCPHCGSYNGGDP